MAAQRTPHGLRNSDLDSDGRSKRRSAPVRRQFAGRAYRHSAPCLRSQNAICVDRAAGKRAREGYGKAALFSHPVAANALIPLQNYANFCERNAGHWRRQGDHNRAVESENEAAEMRNLCAQDAACVLVFGVAFSAATLGFRTVTPSEWRELAGPTATLPKRFMVARRRGDQRTKAAVIATGNALEALFEARPEVALALCQRQLASLSILDGGRL